MKRWWMVIGLTTGCTCSELGGAAGQAPQYTQEPAVDCTPHDTALGELKPWESAGNLVSAVDVGFAVKKMAALEPSMELSSGLSAEDFGVPTLTMTLDPRGAEEMLRTLPTDDSEAARKAREHCEAGTWVRQQGELAIAIPWSGRTLTGTAPITVAAWGPLPTQMSLSTRVLDWSSGSTTAEDWRAMICAGIGQGAACRLGPGFAQVTGTLSEPTLEVVTALEGDRGLLPVRIRWAAGAP